MSAVFDTRTATADGGHAAQHSDRLHAGGAREAAFYSDALAGLGKAVIITDADGGVRYLNPAAERLSGYRCKEVFGWALPALVASAEMIWKSVSGVVKHLQSGAPGQVATLYRRTGGWRRVRISGLPMPPSLGNGFLLEECSDTPPTWAERQQRGASTRRGRCVGEMSMMDARWGYRTDLQARVVLRGARGFEATGVIRNISHRGLFVAIDAPLRVQSCVAVMLMSDDLPGSCLYQTAAIVVHRQGDGVGMMLPDGAGHIIRSLCPMPQRRRPADR